MTLGLSKNIRCHVWPYIFPNLANHQIKHQATQWHRVGRQHGDCIWLLQSSSGVSVGIYLVTYSLYHPWGGKKKCLTNSQKGGWMTLVRILFYYLPFVISMCIHFTPGQHVVLRKKATIHHITSSILTPTWLVSMLIHKVVTLTPVACVKGQHASHYTNGTHTANFRYFWGYHHVYAAIQWFQTL